MQKYTPEDLLLFLYKEANAEMTADIEQALQKDWTLREKLAVLKASMERLNNLTVPPRTEAVLNILKYASSARKVKS